MSNNLEPTRTSEQPKKAPKAPKPRSCANRPCPVKFVPRRPLQSACSPACAVEIAIKKREAVGKQQKAAERKEIKARKEKIKTRGEYVKELGVAHRAWVRARDEGKECISCPTILVKRGAPGGDYDAGHYRGVGRAKHLEFVDMNVNGQCKHCNDHGKGMYLEQRPKMIERYGLPAVEALEADQEPRKYSIPDLVELTKLYRARLRELKRGET